jgi:hypothetical protein
MELNLMKNIFGELCSTHFMGCPNGIKNFQSIGFTYGY